MWHCWCRFLFEKKMRWIFKRKKSKNRIAVYQSFDQSSNAILIHSEFMGVFRNGREALMLMKRHGRYSISTFPFLNSFLNTRFCQALFIRELFPKRVVIVGMVSTVAYKGQKFTCVRIGAIFLKTTSQTTTKIWKSGHGGFLRNLHFCSLDCNIAVRCCKLYIRQQDKRNVFDWGTREYDAK